jgi:TolB-like protein
MITKIKLILFGLFLTSLSAHALLAQQAENIENITLAVMDFKNNSSVFGYDRLERAIPEMLKTELSRSPEILVLERSKIESILKEQALAQTGVIEQETAQEVGRLAGAEYIITGEINTIGNQLRVDAHLLRVATGQVLGEKITGRTLENIEPMVKLLAQNLIFNLTGKGERQNFAKVRRYHTKWALATTAAISITSAILHFNYKNNYDNYHETTQLGEFDPFYDNANKYYKARNIMLMISGAAALTTFTLWRKDQGEENKIYASNHHFKPGNISVAFAMQKGDYFISLGFRF